jgi:hypothetical protein
MKLDRHCRKCVDYDADTGMCLLFRDIINAEECCTSFREAGSPERQTAERAKPSGESCKHRRMPKYLKGDKSVCAYNPPICWGQVTSSPCGVSVQAAIWPILDHEPPHTQLEDLVCGKWEPRYKDRR